MATATGIPANTAIAHTTVQLDIRHTTIMVHHYTLPADHITEQCDTRQDSTSTHSTILESRKQTGYYEASLRKRSLQVCYCINDLMIG